MTEQALYSNPLSVVQQVSSTLHVISQVREILEYVYDGSGYAWPPSTLVEGSVALRLLYQSQPKSYPRNL